MQNPPLLLTASMAIGRKHGSMGIRSRSARRHGVCRDSDNRSRSEDGMGSGVPFGHTQGEETPRPGISPLVHDKERRKSSDRERAVMTRPSLDTASIM